MSKNPQKENGYTPIANEIMEALARIRIPGVAYQVLNFILRKTYGWNKKSDTISLSQFVLATGLSKSAICKAIKRLKLMNIVVVKKDNNGGIKYMFNKHYDKWKSLSKKEKLSKKEMGIVKKGNESLSKKATTKTIYTKTIYTKENNIYDDINTSSYINVNTKTKKAVNPDV